ncbi:MAG: PAS domain S-box protein [Desulfobacula sp.]|jgi:PAS domain S-box-containing protein|uniref:PAS domain-containing sensor histidine kinase n=1 Tax=Desulfobacula sp. TaxID=2593537 RepID=UPI001D8AFBFA|nr:PAS domain S-box protein [Desulfobacula sp.]MBT3487064.1 PAS domain S-box protein [Desulfobacula sp.]MBT3806840.1 PAS domain S-box protein [Desulfobacula sp.]MBT4026783.1 PAS domain S-box protein [Desulfobacula sp.]MBT4199046.1 PAS domain S-box protein [Desulfobacula sp.]
MAKKPTYEELEKRIQKLEKIDFDRNHDYEVLQEDNERFLGIINTAMDSIFCKNFNRQYTFVNPSMIQLFGCSEADLIGKTPEEIFNKEAADIIYEVDQRTLNGEKVSEVRSLTSAGNLYFFHTIQVPLHDFKGNIKGISGIVRDITEHKKVEKALKESERNLQRGQQISKTGSWYYDHNSGNEVWSDECFKLFGTNKEDYSDNIVPGSLNLSIYEHPEKTAELFISLAEKHDTFEFEFTTIPINGQAKVIHSYCESEKDVDGNLLKIFGMDHDITERKKLETELKKREEKFKKIINGSIDGFVITNMYGRIIEVNKAYCLLLGYTRNEILSMSLIELEALMTKEELNNKTLKIIDTGGSRFETKNKKKNGNIIDVEVSASFTPENNGTFLVFIRDITDRKKSEKALINLNKKLDSKVKKRTNELKRLNEHLVLSEDNERKNLASELHDSVAQSLAIAVSQIKNITEADSGYGIKTLPDVQKNIENAIKEVRILIHQLHPPILDDFKIDIVIGCLIEAINEKKQIIINYINNLTESVTLTETTKMTIYRATNELIYNILKHSDSLVAEIELSKINNSIQIRVEDKGKGFEFKTYHQKNYCGFGLYSLFERIENIGGELIINSSLGKGTKVILTVPVNV